MTAAHRVYQNDDVFRVLARHCDKPSLVRLMGIEQTGTIFDTCVKELYKEVDYDDIKSMFRDTPRRSQYLDAVIHIRSDPPRHGKEFALFPMTSIDMADNAEPCSPTEISFLRLKCPNLGVVTRHVTYHLGQRLTIILSKGKRTGTVRIHEQADLLPLSPDHHFVDPIIQIPAIWQGWVIKHTVGLGLFGSGEIVHQWDQELKTLLQDPDRLDRRITQIQTGWLPFNLSELGTIVASRSPNKNLISRLSSTVAPFKASELELFLKMAGKSLYQLHLHTRPHSGFITPYDLTSIIEMVRRDAPNLVDLRLPMLFTNRGRMYVDDYIEFPSVTGPGTIRTLWILAYDLGELGEKRNNNLHTVCSWNFARNLACLLAPEFEIRLTAGPTTPSVNNAVLHDHTGMPFISWVFWQPQLTAAIKFFQRLGPNLKPHLATLPMSNLGVFSVENLEDLTYTTNGEPQYVEPTTTWSYGKKRTWEDFFYGDDPHYQEHVDREDEELQEYLDRKEEEQRQADEDSGYTDFLEEREQEEQDARDEAHQEYLDMMDEQQQEGGNDDDGYDDYIRQQNQEQCDLDAEVDQAYVDMMNERHEDTGYEDHLKEQEQEQHDLDVGVDQAYVDMMNEQHEDTGYEDHLKEQEQEQHDLDVGADQAYVDMMNERHEDTGYEDHIKEQEQEQHDLDVEADQDYLRMMNEQQRDNVDLNNVNIGEQGEVKPSDADDQILQCDGGYQEDLDLPNVQMGTRGLDVAQQDIFASAHNLTQ